DGIKLDAAASRWQRPAATRLSWSRLCRLLACREAKALDATTKTAMNSTTSGWLVLNRPQVAGFELPGDTEDQSEIPEPIAGMGALILLSQPPGKNTLAEQQFDLVGG